MKKTIMFFLCFCVAASLVPGDWGVLFADDKEGRYVFLKGGYIISPSKKTFVLALELREKGARDDFEDLLISKEIAFTQEGDMVYVIGERPGIDGARVKRKDDNLVMWTELDALGGEATGGYTTGGSGMAMYTRD